ncbi:hypothetical protein FIBSPDRAFT_406278 [Athelia psychrophila]|uniref:Uncharacterized protein n=1 Tax=Athelia psychrophila TaxID=1759441 RepID=A0A166N8L8_9AGAM|nr:hypothetical protein FIBSPDRAFT_406278 [Fibularhizoctonia sp. CBS 109695]
MSPSSLFPPLAPIFSATPRRSTPVSEVCKDDTGGHGGGRQLEVLQGKPLSGQPSWVWAPASLNPAAGLPNSAELCRRTVHRTTGHSTGFLQPDFPIQTCPRLAYYNTYLNHPPQLKKIPLLWLA